MSLSLTKDILQLERRINQLRIDYNLSRIKKKKKLLPQLTTCFIIFGKPTALTDPKFKPWDSVISYNDWVYSCFSVSNTDDPTYEGWNDILLDKVKPYGYHWSDFNTVIMENGDLVSYPKYEHTIKTLTNDKMVIKSANPHTTAIHSNHLDYNSIKEYDRTLEIPSYTISNQDNVIVFIISTRIYYESSLIKPNDLKFSNDPKFSIGDLYIQVIILNDSNSDIESRFKTSVAYQNGFKLESDFYKIITHGRFVIYVPKIKIILNSKLVYISQDWFNLLVPTKKEDYVLKMKPIDNPEKKEVPPVIKEDLGIKTATSSTMIVASNPNYIPTPGSIVIESPITVPGGIPDSSKLYSSVSGFNNNTSFWTQPINTTLDLSYPKGVGKVEIYVIEPDGRLFYGLIISHWFGTVPSINVTLFKSVEEALSTNSPKKPCICFYFGIVNTRISHTAKFDKVRDLFGNFVYVKVFQPNADSIDDNSFDDNLSTFVKRIGSPVVLTAMFTTKFNDTGKQIKREVIFDPKTIAENNKSISNETFIVKFCTILQTIYPSYEIKCPEKPERKGAYHEILSV